MIHGILKVHVASCTPFRLIIMATPSRDRGGVPLFCLFVAVFEAFAFCICQLRSYHMQLGWRIRWLNPLSITSIIMAFFGHCVPSEGHATSRDGFSRVSNMPRSHIPSHFSSRSSLAQGNIIHSWRIMGCPAPILVGHAGTPFASSQSARDLLHCAR